MIGFCVCHLCLEEGGNVVYLHTLNVWKAGMGAYEDVVLFAFQDGFLHDERIAGVELLRWGDTNHEPVRVL